MNMRKTLLPVFIFLVAGPCATLLCAANLASNLTVFSYGKSAEDGSFQIASRINLDLAINGGEKYSAIVKFGLGNSNLEKAYNDSVLAADDATIVDRFNALLSPRLELVSFTIRNAFSLPFEFTYFLGRIDVYGSGRDFIPYFGSQDFASLQSGPDYWSTINNPGYWYQGIYEAYGTGLKLNTMPALWTDVVGMLYVYQDSYAGLGRYSVDLRFLFASTYVKAEIFVGTTGINTAHAGLMFYASNNIAGLLLEGGVPEYQFGETITKRHFYALIEPHVDMGPVRLTLSGFYRPGYYNHAPTENQADIIDGLVDVRIGKPEENAVIGGVQATASYSMGAPLLLAGSPSLTATGGPYFTLVAGGIILDFKLFFVALPIPQKVLDAFQPFVGISASF